MHIYWKDQWSDSELIIQKDLLISDNGREYQIVNSIPRFVFDKNYTAAFGLQWNYFRQTQLDSYSKFPLSEQRLKRCH
jgi:hypothetical protein